MPYFFRQSFGCWLTLGKSEIYVDWIRKKLSHLGRLNWPSNLRHEVNLRLRQHLNMPIFPVVNLQVRWPYIGRKFRVNNLLSIMHVPTVNWCSTFDICSTRAFRNVSTTSKAYHGQQLRINISWNRLYPYTSALCCPDEGAQNSSSPSP
jgi:hypothetical protein